MKTSDSPSSPVLIVDDEENVLEGMSRLLRSAGINNVVCCQDSREVMGILSSQPICAVLLDLVMPHVTGGELLPRIVALHPDVPVVIITGTNEIEAAVNCMRAGAADYMVKPVEPSRFLSGVRRVIELGELQRQNALLRQRVFSETIERPDAFDQIITRNKWIFSILRYCEIIATSPRPVLITGETGTGKELLARAIHRLSGRTGEFVAVNVAGLDDNMFSDTLFGHVRGAYTGADESRKGLIDRAGDGTLFLDEIGDLSLNSQTRILRLLQEREYFPLGSDIAKHSNARVIVATNNDLDAARQSGQFRRDLYYRLQAHLVKLPPLRKRADDLPLLVDHFLGHAAQVLKKKKPTPPKELFALLAAYHFPGNVRELESMVFDAVSRHEGHVLSLEVFKERTASALPASGSASSGEPLRPATNLFSDVEQLPSLKEANAMLVDEALKRAHGNQTVAARLLGMQRQALNKRLSRSQDDE